MLFLFANKGFSGFRLPATLLALLLFFVAAAGEVAGSIESEIDSILSRPGVSGNTWSVLIETEEGDVLYSRTPTTPRRPASVTKLFTTAAAFDLLGPAYVWNGQRIDVASRSINRHSNNSMADDLFRYLGAVQGNAYSYDEGSRVVRNWAASVGIDTTGLVLNDGSGLSWHNRISSVQAMEVLRYSLDNYSAFLPTLSRACHYGTLSSRFCGTEGAGNVFGKTGTLPNGQTVSLTGLINHDGQRYYFSFFANNATDVTASRQAIDDAVLVLTSEDWRSTTFAVSDWIRTTAGTLRLRDGPGTGYEILESLPEGTIARVEPHEDNGIRANDHHWWSVRVYPEGAEGWLAEAFLEDAPLPADWPWEEVIVDNSDPGFSASDEWGVADWASDNYGSNYRHRDTEPVSDWARWSAELPGKGSYDVFAWWPAWSNRATAAPYIISHLDGTTTVPMDQTVNGGQWNYLGRFEFAHEGVDQVALSCWTSSGAVVMADAVRFVPVEIESQTEFFVLNIDVDGAGEVERSPDGKEYEQGESVELLAVPETGFSFVGWKGDYEGSENPAAVTMDRPMSVTATFARTYAAWTEVHFTEKELEAGLGGDREAPAGDTIPNLLKYALGLDPHEPASGVLPVPELRTISEKGTETYLTLTISHPAGIADIDYRVELSSDLLDWTDSAILVSKEENDGVTTRTYRDVAPFGASDTRVMRLRVSPIQ